MQLGFLRRKVAKTVEKVFGRTPVVLMLPQQDAIEANQKVEGFTLFFEGPRAELIERAFRNNGSYVISSGAAPSPSWPNGFRGRTGSNQIRLSPAKVEVPEDLRMAEDAWPFLYLRNPMIPDLTWRGIGVVGVISLAMLWLFGWRTGGEQFSRLHITMLLDRKSTRLNSSH